MPAIVSPHQVGWWRPYGRPNLFVLAHIGVEEVSRMCPVYGSGCRPLLRVQVVTRSSGDPCIEQDGYVSPLSCVRVPCVMATAVSTVAA